MIGVRGRRAAGGAPAPKSPPAAGVVAAGAALPNRPPPAGAAGAPKRPPAAGAAGVAPNIRPTASRAAESGTAEEHRVTPGNFTREAKSYITVRSRAM